MPTDICLPILKFSYATGASADHTIPWTHLQASNIFVVVRGEDTRVADGCLSLRVVHGNKVLESIDVAQYVDAAIDARRGAEVAGVIPQVDQLPIFGITKNALLAIRYRLEGGLPRRLQLRLQTHAECRRVVDTLVQRGMEFQEQRPVTARLQTSSSNTVAGQDRLLTATSSSPYFIPEHTATTRPNPFTPQTLEAGSLSRTALVSPERSTQKPGTPTLTMVPPRVLNNDETIAAQESSTSRPSTAQIYRSYTTPPQPAPYRVSDHENQRLQRDHERPMSTLHVDDLPANRAVAAERETTPLPAFEIPPPSLRPSSSAMDLSSSTTDTRHTASLSSKSAEPRPNTARPSLSASTVRSNKVDHGLLLTGGAQTERPESHRSGSDLSGSRPGSSALSMPPLPKPKLVRQGSESPIRPDSESPVKTPGLSRPGTASPLKRSFTVAESDTYTSQTNTNATSISHAMSRQSQLERQPMSVGTDLLSSGPAPRRVPPMNELLYGRRPLAERSPNAKSPRLSSVAGAPREKLSPPSPASELEPPPKQISSSLGPDANNGAGTAVEAHDQADVSLEEYAAQSRSNREAALDDFMVANLENPSFTMLCEDVENCWRRIALGL